MGYDVKPQPDTEMSTMHQADQVMRMLERQRDLYRGLERLARRQRDLVAKEDPAALLTLLADRKRLTQDLTDLTQQLAPVRASWTQARRILSTAQRDEAERILQEMGQIVHGITTSDEEDARRLSARKARTAAQIQAVTSDRKAISAYASTSAPVAHRLDEISEEA
jgi:hypothetical protein